MSALAWLNDLAQWVGRWFPRLVVVHPTHCAVRFGRGGSAVAIGSGLVIWWPLIHDLLEVPITTVSYETCGQILPAAQGTGTTTTLLPQNTVLACAVQFRITDPVRASVGVLMYHALVDNRVRAAIVRFWPGSNDADWCENARTFAAATLIGYGIDLEHLDVTNVGLGCAMKNLSDWSYSDGVDGKRPNSEASK